jgi:hypothetical protein
LKVRDKTLGIRNFNALACFNGFPCRDASLRNEGNGRSPCITARVLFVFVKVSGNWRNRTKGLAVMLKLRIFANGNGHYRNGGYHKQNSV